MDNFSFMYHFNNALSEHERFFKLSSAVLNADYTLVITLILDAGNYDKYLDERLKTKVQDILKELLPDSFRVFTVYKKTTNDPKYISRLAMEYLYNEAPLIFPKIDEGAVSAEAGYDTVTVKFTLPPYIYSFMEEKGFSEKIAAYLDTKLMGNIEVVIVPDGKAESGTAVVRKKRQQAVDSIRVITVETTDNLIGAVSRLPRYISDVTEAESEMQTVCGKVLAFEKKQAKKTGKDFFVFKLNDTTGVIDVKFFPKDENKAKQFEEKVKDGVQLCVEGPIRMDAYLNAWSMTLYRAAVCNIDYSTISNKIVYYDENEEYITVEPLPYVEQEQIDIFGREEEPQLSGVYVVFDLETTGLTASADRIIEIGAVKIIDGAIKETFSTLINPEIPIPPDASKVNNIYDADVKNAPTFQNVVGDFYKFTRNAALVAHNASFDMGFLAYHAKACHYNFDNEVIDTLQIARELLPGKKHNLEGLCKEFGVCLTEAHRALNDAIATAKVFKKLYAIKIKAK